MALPVAGAAENASALPRVSFLHPFNDSYIRTRHNNLRCFPSCAKVHKESSFCGKSVEVKVLKELSTNSKNILVFAEFRAQEGARSYDMEDAIAKAGIKKEEHLEVAEYVNSNDLYFRFVFSPNKKWRYDARIKRQQELHVFSVYVAVNEVIVEIVDSKGFAIIPVWKSEDQGDRKTKDDGDAKSEDGVEGNDAIDGVRYQDGQKLGIKKAKKNSVRHIEGDGVKGDGEKDDEDTRPKSQMSVEDEDTESPQLDGHGQDSKAQASFQVANAPSLAYPSIAGYSQQSPYAIFRPVSSTGLGFTAPQTMSYVPTFQITSAFGFPSGSTFPSSYPSFLPTPAISQNYLGQVPNMIVPRGFPAIGSAGVRVGQGPLVGPPAPFVMLAPQTPNPPKNVDKKEEDDSATSQDNDGSSTDEE